MSTTTSRSKGSERRARKRSPLKILEAARTSRTYAAPRSVFGTPAWYDELCERQQRAVWRGQMTEAESSFELRYWHWVLLIEMTRKRLWRRPRRKRTG
jgi:hypothetical protein